MKTLPTRAAVFLVAAAFASVAIARGPRDDERPKPATAAAPEVKLTPEQTRTVDERFLKCAASGNMLTLKMCEYVAEQVQNPEVKAVAEMLFKHHVECKMNIDKTAEQSKVELPADMSAVDKAKLEAFKEVKGDMVAGPFLFCMASGHVHAILEVSCEQKTTQDAAIKGYCEKALPVLKKHFAKVKPMAEAKAGVTSMTDERSER